MTKDEFREVLIEVLGQYITPFYQIIGALIAAIVLALTVYFIISPFIKRI